MRAKSRLFSWILLSLALHGCGGTTSGGGGSDVVSPTVPAGLQATPASSSQIDLSWRAASDNVGVAGYRLYRNGALIATPANTQHADSGLAAATQYCYRVSAYDGANNESVWSDQQCATTAAPLAPPAAPTAVDALGGDGRITLRWAPVSGATSYNLYVATAAGVGKLNYSSLAGGDRIAGATSPYLHAGRTNQTTYFYTVTAVGAGGESAESLQVAVQSMTPAARGWKSLQPATTTNHLHSVRFIGSATGWAVGDAGTIIRTTNAGAAWTIQDSRTTSRLSDVDFADAANGWAVGGGGPFGQTYATILRTTDGGTTWRTQASGNAPILSGVDFVDAANGWAVGDNGTILHTADGGRTWSAQTSGTTAALWKVRFVNASTGWASGGNGNEGVVLKTTDGGLSWSAETILGAQLYALDFASATHGWMADPAQPGRIFATTNGGATWGPLPSGTLSLLNGIAFADTATGWAVGSSGTILRSSNGGGSWTAQASGTAAALHAVAAIDAQTAWAVGAGGVIVHTANGGTSWSRQDFRTLPPFSPATLTLTSATVGWAASGATPYRTANGGVSWTARPVFSAEPLGWMQFVSATTGWAVGIPAGGGTCGAPPCYGVYRTLDGGDTWELRGHVASSAIQIGNVDFLDDTRGWAVGANGVVRVTTDGGATWSAKNSGLLSVLTAVKAVDATTVWATGTGGIILRSTDGGDTWTGQISGTTQDLRAIAAADRNRAWVVGGNSSAGVAPLLATSDGGLTWTQQNGAPGWFNDVHFASPTTGWAVGPGLLLGTTDGGATWTAQRSGTARELHRVRFADPLTGWIAAEGDLLGTTTGGN